MSLTPELSTSVSTTPDRVDHNKLDHDHPGRDHSHVVSFKSDDGLGEGDRPKSTSFDDLIKVMVNPGYKGVVHDNPLETIKVDGSTLGPLWKATLQAALSAWEAVVPVAFSVEDGGKADLRVVDDQGNLFNIAKKFVSVQRGIALRDYDQATRGRAIYHVYLHELGHALGLGHPGHYNTAVTFKAAAGNVHDNWQNAVMSYFNQGIAETGRDSWLPVTPMRADVEAFIQLYHSHVDGNGKRSYNEVLLNTGNDNYGFGANARKGYRLSNTDEYIDLEPDLLASADRFKANMLREMPSTLAGLTDDQIEQLTFALTEYQSIDIAAWEIIFKITFSEKDREFIARERLLLEPSRVKVLDKALPQLLNPLRRDIGFTIHDTGGRDTIDFSGSTHGTVLDLRAGHFSSVNGLTNNVFIFAGHNADQSDYYIETGIGSSHDDRITGNDGDNTLSGNEGDDTLDGGGGNDILYGGKGKDRLTGGAGADTFAFTDILDSRPDNSDTISDFNRSQHDKIDLSRIDADGDASNGLTAFRLSHTGPGRPGTNRKGLLWLVHTIKKTFINGDIDGDGNADFTINLGGRVSLREEDFNLTDPASAGLLPKGAGPDFDAPANHIEIGTDGADNFRTLRGPTHFVGGAGIDTIDYAGDDALSVNLALNRGLGGGANGDTFDSIENLIGGAGADFFVGNQLDNEFWGNDGGDRLLGGGGNDRLHGGAEQDTLEGDDGDDTLFGDDGDDKIVGGLGRDILNGGSGTDNFYGRFSEFAGDIITDLSAGESLHISDVLANELSFAVNGNLLTLKTGSSSATLTLGNEFSGTLVKTVGHYGGVDLTLTAPALA